MESIQLTVHDASPTDSGRGIVRVDPVTIAALQARIGDVVAICGTRTTYGRILPSRADERGQARVSMDGMTRKSAGVATGETIEISKSTSKPANELTLKLAVAAPSQSAAFQDAIRRRFDAIPLSVGDQVRVRLIGGDEIAGEVTGTNPSGAVFLQADTKLNIEGLPAADEPSGALSYEDLGGLGKELARVREMIELPIRRPEIFEHLGIEAPKGVLLSGPPGTGKTLLARAVAEECNATFFQINGPEIIGKHYGESEKQLRDVFKRAEAKAPSIVFIDELDAIAPKRDALAGDKQVERRIVAQLLTLLDGTKGRGQTIVMAATNLPDSLDPALRRPGRFDREVVIGVPDRTGRREILAVHTRGMPLADDVDLDALAAKTHGFVGADIAALCREAGMSALRSAVHRGLDVADAHTLSINASAFDQAFAETRPSALREVFSDVPDVRWSDVGGLDDIRQTLTEAIVWPLVRPDLFETFQIAPAKGVLLTGAPGTGKTLVAKALANEAGVNFISVRGPQLLNQYVGESEKAVREIFSKARSTAPTILFFDEIDALAPVRGSGDSAVLERVVGQFLTEIDGIDELKGVFLLGATNRADAIDPALRRPGRFDLVIEMPVPDTQTRQEILAIHTAKMPLLAEVDLNVLAEATPGFVGADLAALAQGAARLALRRAYDGGETGIAAADFIAVLPDLMARTAAVPLDRQTGDAA